MYIYIYIHICIHTQIDTPGVMSYTLQYNARSIMYCHMQRHGIHDIRCLII